MSRQIARQEVTGFRETWFGLERQPINACTHCGGAPIVVSEKMTAKFRAEE